MSNPDLTPDEVERLRKRPAPGSGKLERFTRRLARRREAAETLKQAVAQERAELRAVRHSVFLRDGRRDRAFGTPLLFETDNLLKQSHAHHLTFKSAGGADVPENLITVSFKTHQMLHEGFLEAEGDGNGTVTFSQYEFSGGTRRLVRVWESSL